eukprot:14138048-Alexandrium_andersonii.AAC.1
MCIRDSLSAIHLSSSQRHLQHDFAVLVCSFRCHAATCSDERLDVVPCQASMLIAPCFAGVRNLGLSVRLGSGLCSGRATLADCPLGKGGPAPRRLDWAFQSCPERDA